LLTFAAHQESISICGMVSTMDPAREIELSASLNDSPKASSTAMASIAVRPSRQHSELALLSLTAVDSPHRSQAPRSHPGLRARRLQEFRKAALNTEQSRLPRLLHRRRISDGFRIVPLDRRSRRRLRSSPDAKPSRSFQSGPACYAATIFPEPAPEDQHDETSQSL